jgi:hypothetical protein
MIADEQIPNRQAEQISSQSVDRGWVGSSVLAQIRQCSLIRSPDASLRQAIAVLHNRNPR